MDAPAPDVDVILPTLDCAGTLRRCLTAVRAQRYGGRLLVTVVDGGSRDDTVAVAREFGATVHANPGQYGTGLTGSRHFGEVRTNAPLVWLLDADNRPTTPTVAASLVGALTSDPSIQVAVPTLDVPGHQGSFSRWLAWIEETAIEAEAARGRPVDGRFEVDRLGHGISNGSMIRRTALVAAGGYDSDVRLLDRLRRQGLARGAIVPSAQIVHDQAEDLFHFGRKARARIVRFGGMSDAALRAYFVDYPVPPSLEGDLRQRLQGGFLRAPWEGLAGWWRTGDRAWLWGITYPWIVLTVAARHPWRSWRVYRRFL